MGYRAQPKSGPPTGQAHRPSSVANSVIVQAKSIQEA